MGQRRISRVAIWLLTAAACTSVGIGVAGVASAAATTTPTAHPTVTVAKVKIINFVFKPGTLTIAAGTRVKWTNLDSTGHNMTFAKFASPILATGDTYAHTFKTAGTFKYYCSLHPEMTAKVVVT